MRKKGFTLIEIITVIALIGIIAGVAMPPILGIVDALVFDRTRNDIVGMGQAAMRRLSIEMRRLRDVNAVLIADASHYRFIDNDGVTVDLSLNTGSNTLVLDRGGSAYTLSAYATGLNFSYFDESSSHTALTGLPLTYNGTNEATAIHTIQVSLTLENTATSGGPLTFQTEIRPPNIPHLETLFP